MDSLIPRSVDLSETRQPNLYAATIVPGVFALVCVSLRFWSRWTNKAGFWLDDWLIICALMCAVGLWATAFWWTPHALGKHIQTFGPNVGEDMYIGLFSCELTYTDADMTWNLVNHATWAMVEINFAIISACLPTIRPVWLAIRQKSLGTKMSQDKVYHNAASSASKQLDQPSWTIEILNSHADEENRQPYSTIPAPRGYGSPYGLTGNVDVARKAVAIPLPTAQPQYGHYRGAIRVDNGWDVEYGEQSQARDVESQGRCGFE